MVVQVNGISIELLAVVIIALSSIFTNVLTWFLSYHSTRTKFETETRARYIQEALRDCYKLYNFLRQLQSTPLYEEALKATKDINKIVSEHPYNFKATIINKWIGIYETITLPEEFATNEIEDILKDVWERIDYFEDEYEKIMGIKRWSTGFKRLKPLR